MTKMNKLLLSAVCVTALMAGVTSAANAGGLYVEDGKVVEAYPDSVFEFSNDEVTIEVAEPATNTIEVQAVPVSTEIIVEQQVDVPVRQVVTERVVTAAAPAPQMMAASYTYDAPVAEANVQYRDALSHYDAAAPILSQEIVTHEYECCEGEYTEEVVTKVIPGTRTPVQKVITRMVPQAAIEVEDVVTEYIAQPAIEYHEVIVYRVEQEPKAVQKTVKRLVEQPAKEVQEVITEYIETPSRSVQEVIRRAAPRKMVQYEEIITHQIKPVGVTRTIPVAEPVVRTVVQQPQTYSCTLDANGNPVIAQ